LVDIRQAPGVGAWRFVLTPNQSLSWRGTQWLFLSLVVLSTIIGLGFASRGLWLVLPFAGLEMAALGAGLYVVSRSTHRREVIHVAKDDIRIERGWNRPIEVSRLPRNWSRVELVRSGYWNQSRLTIRACGRSEEVGGFLNEQERLGLACDLARALAT
jgi:uncharacterized membrane protein